MKKIFTLLFISLLSLSLRAYDGGGLSISAINSGSTFKVEVDGRKVFMRGNQVTLSNLVEGYHNVRIFRESNRNNFGSGFGRKDQIIYSTSVFLSRDYQTDIIISRSGKVLVDSYRIGPEIDWYNTEDGGNDDDNMNNNGGGWNHGHGNVMSTQEFKTARESINQEWFETSRLTLAKTIMDNNNFTVQQVKEMMLLFIFENNRLEVAKYAYRKTADKQNYYQLNDVLTFSSTKEELARFIRESR